MEFSNNLNPTLELIDSEVGIERKKRSWFEIILLDSRSTNTLDLAIIP